MARLIIVGGGTGSGKSTLADSLASNLNGVVIRIDDYYRPLDHLTFDERALVNFDSPDSIDVDFLIEHLAALMSHCAIEQPIYDFSRHTRAVFGREVRPNQTIVVEGLFALYWAELRQMCTTSIYVDTELDTRFARRLKRDIEERGRDRAEVTQRFRDHVNPMHEQFVEPTKVWANVIVSGDCDLSDSLQTVLSRAAGDPLATVI